MATKAKFTREQAIVGLEQAITSYTGGQWTAIGWGVLILAKDGTKADVLNRLKDAKMADGKPISWARKAANRERAACGQLTSDLTVNEACCRYWEEVGMHQASSDDTAKALEDVKRLIGGDVLLVDITAEKIAAAAARRAGEPLMVRQNVNGQIVMVPTGKTVSLSTVNRQIVEPLRRMLRRARKVWNVPIEIDSIPWNELRYREPTERVREMSAEEAQRFWSKLRPDYHPICRFYLLSGRRRSEVVGLMRSDVDLSTRKVRFAIRKKRQLTKVAKTLTPSQAAIIETELGKTTGSAVFTYVVQRGTNKGRRRPITEMGLKTEIRRALTKAGIADFRLHDMRHTFASALLRASGGNFALVQKALDHSDIKSTLRYAHVLDEDVVAGIEKLERSRNYPGSALGHPPAEPKDTAKSDS